MIPTQDFMILEKHESVATTVILPDGVSQVDESTIFTVMAIGRGCYEYGQLVPLECKVGDEVLVASYAPLKIPGTDDDTYMARDKDVIMILKRADKQSDAGSVHYPV